MSNSNQIKHILEVETKQGKKLYLLEAKKISIGRSVKNSIVIDHISVSRHHATLTKMKYKGKDDDVFWLVDGDLKGNRSTNGILVNGKRCFSHELRPGDEFFIGGYDVKAKYDTLTPDSKQELYSQLDQQLEISKVRREVEEDIKETIKSTQVNYDEDEESTTLDEDE